MKIGSPRPAAPARWSPKPVWRRTSRSTGDWSAFRTTTWHWSGDETHGWAAAIEDAGAATVLSYLGGALVPEARAVVRFLAALA